MKPFLGAALSLLLVATSSAEVVLVAPSLTVSSATVTVEGRPAAKVGLLPGGPQRRAAVGAGVGLSEGKPLQVMVWSGAGAIVGSTVGPLGTVVGAAAGSVFGLLFSIFAAPRA